MLDHECLHVKYGHPWFLGFIQLLEIVYWFNPLVRLMMNQLRLDLEYFIDEKLLENKPQKERIDYANLLLSFSADHDQSALQCLNSKRTRKRLKERMGWIVNKKRTPWLLAAGIVVFWTQNSDSPWNPCFRPSPGSPALALPGPLCCPYFSSPAGK